VVVSCSRAVHNRSGWNPDTRFYRLPRLTERDTIVLADFVNKTRDPEFDGTLQQGLTVWNWSSRLIFISEGRSICTRPFCVALASIIRS
jgi:hypothetical protein